MRRLLGALGAAVLAAGALSSCATKPSGATVAGTVLRLGYFANLTHATPLVAEERGTFEARVGGGVETQVFNAGPAAIEALFAGSIDATYIGPNPAINAFSKSKGKALRIVAGATSGGAQLVVQPGIATPSDLRGTTLATPQLGNTQDVALRDWLQRTAGLKTDPQRGGDVTIAPTDNATTLQLFKDRKIDGAWLPEPWASRLVIEGGGSVLVDERDLWPDGQFVTTHLVVAATFLAEHPDVVKRLLEAHAETTAWINAHPDEAKEVVNDALERLTQKRLSEPVLDRAFDQLTITNDPVAPTLERSAKHAVGAGLLGDVVLHGIYDLRLLNQVLAATGAEPVTAAGLGDD